MTSHGDRGALWCRVVLLIHTAGVCQGQLQWEVIFEAGEGVADVPGAREDAGLGYDDVRGELVLYGGKQRTSGGDVTLGDTWIYHLSNNSWRQIHTETSPGPRSSFVCGTSGHYFYLTLGEGTSQRMFDDIWRFDIRTESWERLSDTHRPSYYSDSQWNIERRGEVRPSPRSGAAGGIFQNSSRFFTAFGDSDIHHGDTFCFNIRDMQWIKESDTPHVYTSAIPHPRSHHAATMTTKDDLVIHGGCLSGGGTGGPCPSGDSWTYNARTRLWRQLPGCASPRQRASMAMLPMTSGQRRVVMYGGEEDSIQVLVGDQAPANQVAVLDPDSETWTLRKTQGVIPASRAGAAMVTGRDGIYMMGGSIRDGSTQDHRLYLLQGSADSADLAPLSGSCGPLFFSLPALHGILMALTYGFFLPGGVFVARYLRHKRRVWFHLHWVFQAFGLCVGVAGLICAFISVKSHHFRFLHGLLGIIAMAFLLFQPISGVIRPSSPEEGGSKRARRVVWEFGHAMMGSVLLLLGLVNISLGVLLHTTPSVVVIVWFSYLGALVIVFIIAEMCLSCQRRHWMKYNWEKPQRSDKYVVKETNNTQPHGGPSAITFAYANPSMGSLEDIDD